MKNGSKKNETDSKLDCYHNRVKPVLTLLYLYLKIKIHGQLININEVTDFYNGFLTIFKY